MMNKSRISSILFLIVFSIACGFGFIYLRNSFIPQFDSRQEIMESGETVMGTAAYVEHKGILNMGVRYAQLAYEVDGESYECEVRFAQNFRKLPGEEDSEGRYPVLIHYDEDEPENAAIECAQKGWKLAKFSMMALIILMFLNAAVLLLTLFMLGKEEYMEWKLSRF